MGVVPLSQFHAADLPEKRPRGMALSVGFARIFTLMGHHFQLSTMWHERCPECGEGKIFDSRWHMNPNCPKCGLKFERGPGYFTGAMYFSYALGIPIITAGTLIVWWITKWPLYKSVLLVWVLFLPLVPWVFRMSRTLFIHFDRYFDPDDKPVEPPVAEG